MVTQDIQEICEYWLTTYLPAQYFIMKNVHYKHILNRAAIMEALILLPQLFVAMRI